VKRGVDFDRIFSFIFLKGMYRILPLIFQPYFDMLGSETIHNVSGTWNPGRLDADFTRYLAKDNSSIKTSLTCESCSDIGRLIVALEVK
jgi:hypothetical protein